MSLALHMNKKKEGSLFFRLHAAEAEKFLSVHFLHKAFSYIPQKNDSDGGTCALFIRSSGLHQMPQIGFVGKMCIRDRKSTSYHSIHRKRGIGLFRSVFSVWGSI